MQEVMTRIELGGGLGKTFGKVHHRLISRVNEASVALAKTIPGFEQFMISSQRRGLTYSVFKGKKNIGVDDLGYPVTGDVIRIVPVIIGSKKAGLLQTILGQFWLPLGRCLISHLGCGITILIQIRCRNDDGGVVQMLSPQPAGWPANRVQITAPHTRSVESPTPPRRAIRYRFFMVVGKSAVRLFLPGFMSKTSNK